MGRVICSDKTVHLRGITLASDYENPAQLFLENHSVTSLADVIAYTEFLLAESGISSDPPINLQAILNRFGIPQPKYANLPQQQGMMLPNFEPLQMIIHAGDSITRQKFSIAHELIETLFLELPGKIRLNGQKENIFGIAKERICNEAAANLLMPKVSFHPKAIRMGLSFHTAELLADDYEVSLMATICRLVDMYPKQGIMVLWQLRNKPSELKKEVSEKQIEMPGFHPSYLPARKLRVAWKYGDYKGRFLPIEKSIPEDSSVYVAWKSNAFAASEEIIPFGSYNVKAIIESKPINIGEERQVISLIR
jgi:Zn-dependent peptidase ImmA (M78 family)